MSATTEDVVEKRGADFSVSRLTMPGERCPKCNGVRGRVIARVMVVKEYNDGFKVHEYKYLRLTHRKMLRDGTLKRTYCYLAVKPKS
ncbi:MAG: hypothetical protein JRN09_05040 [Nitrososphaerota archaeon]|jgi:hypothetical protein|nr:hypothetical protein [Nitrososphaerota archaeon]